MILGFDYRSFRIAIFCSCFSVRTIVFLVLCVSFKLIVVVHVIWLDFVVFSETATEELLFVMFFSFGFALCLVAEKMEEEFNC